MKLRNLWVWSFVLCLGAVTLRAQDATEIEQLKRQLKQATDNFEKAMQEQRRVIDELQRKVETLQKASTSAAPALAAAPGTNAVGPRATNDLARKPWAPTDPIRIVGTPQNYLDLSFVGLFAVGGSTADDIPSLQLGAHDPQQNGFTVQNLETTLAGKVDPYFRGQASIVLQIDPDGETTVEAEEAYLESLSLPLNLQLKAGQYFTEFGRLNPTHPHVWDFVDQPLVNGRFFGGDGLRNPGARLSWLAPTPFYSELFLSVQNSQGETAFSFRQDNEDEFLFGRAVSQGNVNSVDDMLFTPRYAASFDLSASQTLVAGVSGAFGLNGSGNDQRTEIYGVDFYWKWKPTRHHRGFPFVSWQTEAMFRRYGAGAYTADFNGNGLLDSDEADVLGDGTVYAVPGETLKDWGIYSQIAWGFRPGWVAAFRGDFAGPLASSEYEAVYGPDTDRTERWRLAPNLTWFPTEFSKFRLQYNYDYRRTIGPDHSVWLQFEFLLGAHAAHKF